MHYSKDNIFMIMVLQILPTEQGSILFLFRQIKQTGAEAEHDMFQQGKQNQ